MMNKCQLLLLLVGLTISFVVLILTIPYMKNNPPLIIVFVFSVSSFLYLFVESLFMIYFTYVKKEPYKLFEQ